jgi:hypothetical protein
MLLRRWPMPQILATLLAVHCKPAPRTLDATGTRDAASGAAEKRPEAPGRKRLAVVLVEDATAPAERPFELGLRADAALRRALQAPTGFEPAPHADETACKANAEVAYALLQNGAVVKAAEAGSARFGIIAEAHCPYHGEVESYRVEVDDEAPFGPNHGKTSEQALDALLGGLSERAAEALYGQVSMRHASDPEVHRALQDDTRPGVLMEAASEAGERKLTAAIPDLIRLVRHPVEMVQLRAGGALGQLRDKSDEVLRALAAMTDGPTTERHLVAVHALGDIGGPEAARYLETIAVGHPAVVIRNLAREAARSARGESLLPAPEQPGKMPPLHQPMEER